MRLKASTSKEWAARYRVSRSCVDALKQRKSLRPVKGLRIETKFRARVLGGATDRLQAIVAAQPDRTLREVQAALDTPASVTTIWRELGRSGLTLKKKPYTLTNNAGRMWPTSDAAGGEPGRPRGEWLCVPR